MILSGGAFKATGAEGSHRPHGPPSHTAPLTRLSHASQRGVSGILVLEFDKNADLGE